MDEPRWLDGDQQRAWRGYVRMEGRLNARLNRELQDDSDLSLADFAVLVALTDVPQERLRAAELARELDWEKSRLSHHVGRMERRGLVRREDCEDDGRGQFVVLTPDGRAAIERAAPGHAAAVLDLLFAEMTPQELAALTRITERVLGRLGAS
jgi:DNA-binding MarR family transcriptional regulator